MRANQAVKFAKMGKPDATPNAEWLKIASGRVYVDGPESETTCGVGSKGTRLAPVQRCSRS